MKEGSIVKFIPTRKNLSEFESIISKVKGKLCVQMKGKDVEISTIKGYKTECICE